MEFPETRYVEVDGAYVAYHVTGSGEFDVLSFISSTLPITAFADPPIAPFIDHLASFSRVIRFDRRGSGMSDPITGGSQWTLEHFVDDALAVLDACAVNKCAVLALDTPTTPVSVMLAAGHPERVSALVLWSPNPRPRAAPDFPFGMPPQEADRFAQRWVEELMAGRVWPPRTNLTSEVADWLVRMRRMCAGPASFRAAVGVWVDSDVRALLPTIQAPTLVLHGGGGRRGGVSSPDLARYVAGSIARSSLVEVPGDPRYLYLGAWKPMLDEIEEFLTGVRPPPESDRVLATVLMTDIVESTSRTATVGDRAWRDLLDRHDAIVRTELDRHRGRKVNSIGLGDGVLATFDGPARACRCACALHESIRSSLGIDIRAGLHTGEIELRGDDVTGMAVNIAARVMGLADANETLVSRTVTDLVAGSGLEFAEKGEHELKGVPGRWAIYSVVS